MIEKDIIKQLIMIIISCCLVGCAGAENRQNGTNPDDDGPRSDCIFTASIRGYSVLDESNLVVEASRRQNYHVALRQRANGLRSSQRISFDSATSRICPRFSDVIYGSSLRGGIDAGRVRIDSIRHLSPEEHEDLLIRYGKKEPEIKQTPAPVEIKGAEVEELDPAAAGN